MLPSCASSSCKQEQNWVMQIGCCSSRSRATWVLQIRCCSSKKEQNGCCTLGVAATNKSKLGAAHWVLQQQRSANWVLPSLRNRSGSLHEMACTKYTQTVTLNTGVTLLKTHFYGVTVGREPGIVDQGAAGVLQRVRSLHHNIC